MTIFNKIKKWWEKKSEVQTTTVTSSPQNTEPSSWRRAFELKKAGYRFVTRPKKNKRIKSKAILGALVRITPGKRHAWYESNLGIIRKPYYG